MLKTSPHADIIPIPMQPNGFNPSYPLRHPSMIGGSFFSHLGQYYTQQNTFFEIHLHTSLTFAHFFLLMFGLRSYSFSTMSFPSHPHNTWPIHSCSKT